MEIGLDLNQLETDHILTVANHRARAVVVIAVNIDTGASRKCHLCIPYILRGDIGIFQGFRHVVFHDRIAPVMAVTFRWWV